MTQPQLPAVPDYLKAFVTQPSADAESMASASMSIPRVSLRAKKFRFIENSEELFTENESHVVILAVEPEPGKFVKTYYEGVYNSGDSSPPTCSSSNGIAPDAWVTSKQSDFCSTCPKNVFGSATSRSGKKAKACRDSKRLWVARADDISGTVYGLGVPVTSLKELSALGQQLKSFNVPISAAVIRLSMDEDESFPTLFFNIAGWLKEEFGKVAMERNALKDWAGANKTTSPQLSGPAASAGPALSNQATSAPAPQTAKASSPSGSTFTPASAPTTTEKVVEGEVVPKSNNVDDALSSWGG